MESSYGELLWGVRLDDDGPGDAANDGQWLLRFRGES
jgi:hypothetical protein